LHGIKALARLSDGFSKKLDCHLAAVALYVAFYNLCRSHEALRMTPGMALGITDRVDSQLTVAGHCNWSRRFPRVPK
jgi:hypothetical protein